MHLDVRNLSGASIEFTHLRGYFISTSEAALESHLLSSDIKYLTRAQ